MIQTARTITRLLFSFVLAVLCSCSSKQKMCEHARDRFVEMSKADSQLAAHDAPADQKAAALDLGKRIAGAVHEGFVAPCLTLSDKGSDCMKRIDTFADAYLSAQRGQLECSAKYPDDGEFESRCAKWYDSRRAAESAFGSVCNDTLDEIFDQAWPGL